MKQDNQAPLRVPCGGREGEQQWLAQRPLCVCAAALRCVSEGLTQLV